MSRTTSESTKAQEPLITAATATALYTGAALAANTLGKKVSENATNNPTCDVISTFLYAALACIHPVCILPAAGCHEVVSRGISLKNGDSPVKGAVSSDIMEAYDKVRHGEPVDAIALFPCGFIGGLFAQANNARDGKALERVPAQASMK